MLTFEDSDKKVNSLSVALSLIADEQKENEDRLCYDTFLNRIPWPWIGKSP